VQLLIFGSQHSAQVFGGNITAENLFREIAQFVKLQHRTYWKLAEN